jgi:hypothetical protein
VSLVPAPEPAAVAADPLAVTAADYADAERAGTREAWRAFITLHREGGFYVELARAQLNRIAETQAPPAAIAVAAPSPEPSRPAPTPTRVAALPSPAPTRTEPAPPPAGDPCTRETAQLSALRNAASPEAVAAFAREMTCAALRPQVKRLVESFGLKSNPSPTPTRLAARNPETSGCEGETRELERLRAAPDAAQAKALYDGLVCATLRPQVARLLESLGEAPAPSPTAAAQRAPRLSAAATDDAAVCAEENGELTHLRANPSRDAARTFAEDLRCRALRPQAQRLLESLSD